MSEIVLKIKEVGFSRLYFRTELNTLQIIDINGYHCVMMILCRFVVLVYLEPECICKFMGLKQIPPPTWTSGYLVHHSHTPIWQKKTDNKRNSKI